MSAAKRSPGRVLRRIRAVPGLFGYVLTILLFFVAGLGTTTLLISESNANLPWQDTRTIKVEFRSVPAVTTASSQVVRIAGVELGQITKAEATDRGTALLTLTIEAGHPIHANAHAVLRPVNPLNQMYVEIDPGGPPAPELADGAVIPVSQTSYPIQTDQILNKFDDRTQRAITDLLSQADVALANAPRDFPPGISATDQTLVDLRPAVQALQTREQKLRELVTSVGQIAQAVGGNQERALRLAEATETTLGVLGDSSGQLQASFEELPGLSQELRNALTATQELTEQLDPTLDSLNRVSGELPETLERFTDTTRTLGETVRAAKPVVEKAKPLVEDLRPLAEDVDVAMDDVVQITGEADRIFRLTTEYLTELRAFVYNTSSVFGPEDATSGMIRAHVTVPLPDGGFAPQNGGYVASEEQAGPDGHPEGGGFAPTPEENGLPPCSAPVANCGEFTEPKPGAFETEGGN